MSPGVSVANATLLERVNTRLSATVRLLCAVLLLLMVVFTVYTVVMRYVFHNPPFWGDTLSVFCNIWVTMLGYSLAVRDREDIALRAFYKVIPPRAGFLLDMVWTAMVFAFGVYLVWFGCGRRNERAGNVLGARRLEEDVSDARHADRRRSGGDGSRGVDARGHPDPQGQASRARPCRCRSGSHLGPVHGPWIFRVGSK